METTIGSSLRQSPRIVWLLLTIWSVEFGSTLFHARYVSGFTLAILVCLVCGFYEANRRDVQSPFGFRLTPLQGWTWWVKAALVLAILLSAALGGYAIVIFLGLGYEIPETHMYINQHTSLVDIFVWMCINAPLREEVLYRLALGPPLVVLVGARGAIVMGGLAFAVIHVVGGNQSPENLIGGFILMWAYLKGESLLVPIALHAAGNWCAFVFQVGYYYWNA